jgi:hypothetical protein
VTILFKDKERILKAERDKHLIIYIRSLTMLKIMNFYSEMIEGRRKYNELFKVLKQGLGTWLKWSTCLASRKSQLQTQVTQKKKKKRGG